MMVTAVYRVYTNNNEITVEARRALFNTIFLRTFLLSLSNVDIGFKIIRKINTTELKYVKRMTGFWETK